MLLLALLAGCASESPQAAPADLDAPCQTSSECEGGLSCMTPSCTGCEGQLQCTCQAPSVCAAELAGRQGDECPAGALSCPCLEGTCGNAGLECSDGTCRPSDCIDGREHCACEEGECDEGLSCDERGTCADARGSEGGPCFDNGRCNDGLRCEAAADGCLPCTVGTPGCACSPGGLCEDSTCIAGQCVDQQAIPPDQPRCFTPCQSNLTTPDGQVRLCDSDGLMAGCIGEQQCIDGSCVAPETAPPFCEGDLDCPAFQTCLQGGCYSNCEANADCPAGTGCHMKVCRPACRVTSDTPCPPNQFCDAPDGENGFCSDLPAPSDPTDEAPVQAAFTTSLSTVDFTNLQTSGSVRLLVDSDTAQRFTVRKISHRVFRLGTAEPERVELPRDPASGEYLECDPVAGECPLHWLEMGDSEATLDRAAQLQLLASPQCGDQCPTLHLGRAAAEGIVAWEGLLEITGAAGTSYITLRYAERPEGRWAGDMVYFGSFDERGLERWRQDVESAFGEVSNALLERWSALRLGRLPGGWQEFKAVLRATREGSWRFGSIKAACPDVAGSDKAACYPLDNAVGMATYVSDEDRSPIPTGPIEFPVAMNLRAEDDAPSQLTGRIESDVTLHYAGNPAIALSFEGDPTSTAFCDEDLSQDCVVDLTGLQATIAVGGRHRLVAGERCDPDRHVTRRRPWLLPDFVAGTELDPDTARRTVSECRSGLLPYEVDDPSVHSLNVQLSGSNPVPDGRPRLRNLRLLDGALVNQSELFILFEERFDSFLDAGDDAKVSAYGYMLLRRQPADLDLRDETGEQGVADVFEGSSPQIPAEAVPAATAGATCSPQLLDELGFEDPTLLSREQRDALASVLIEGTASASGVAVSARDVHWLCEETGAIDYGRHPESNFDKPCPQSSAVTYFRITPDVRQPLTAQNIQACNAQLECQRAEPDLEAAPDLDGDGESGLDVEQPQLALRCRNPRESCARNLEGWLAAGDAVQLQAACDTEGSQLPVRMCADDAYELTVQRRFFEPRPSAASLPSLPEATVDAFRYRLLFANRAGEGTGFAPAQCETTTRTVPYCYAPQSIEALRDRYDCLLQLATLDEPDSEVLSSATRTKLYETLRTSFSRATVTAGPQARDGFERLYAELLILLGDEALTAAFASRFDLAALGGASFPGSQLEPGGIDLSGVAGFEMHSLYKATQYYQMVLDRLYRLGPDLSASLAVGFTGDPANFVTAQTVTLYFDRVIRASTQRARAFSEIAKRYQSFNRPDLARSVIARAYSASYLESVILSRLMLRIAERSRSSERPQIRKTIEDAQRRYRMGMLEMRNLYSSISDDLNFFGFPPDYIPFPALDSSNLRDTNAFEVMMRITNLKLALAKQREQEALASKRSFEGDSASFQSELVRIRQTFDGMLGELCGTVQVQTPDGNSRVLPAIARYAPLIEGAELVGDPCGLVGNGQIHAAIITWSQSLKQVDIFRQRFDNIIREAEIERRRVSAQCGISGEIAQHRFEVAGEVRDIRKETAQTRAALDATARHFTSKGQAAATAVQGELGSGIAAAAAQIVFDAAASAVTLGADLLVAESEAEIATLEAEGARWEALKQCDAAQVDSNARLTTLLLGLKELELEIGRAQQQIALNASEIIRLRNEAKRRQAEREENEELLINFEAARNNPNIRLYRNDAIINADVAFEDTIRHAYRATKMFEYYTSQSYGPLAQLFLIRMVAAGDYNLENYLFELQNAFFEFEEQFGVPDTRVQVVSLRDDILNIPRLDDQGLPLSESARIDMMRERLADVHLLDDNGYLSLSYGSDLRELSPLTRNHKVLFVEADIIGSKVGDTMGRLYLRQNGTGVIRNVDGDTDYYRLPDRTAVVDPLFNGNRVFSPEVYKNHRLRERPLVNSEWQLVINKRDEAVNDDIDLQSLSDIRLYVYYTDFTAF